MLFALTIDLYSDGWRWYESDKHRISNCSELAIGVDMIYIFCRSTDQRNLCKLIWETKNAIKLKHRMTKLPHKQVERIVFHIQYELLLDMTRTFARLNRNSTKELSSPPNDAIDMITQYANIL